MGTLAQRLQSERLRYPGLLPEETLVLRAWLALHQGEYDRFDYNIRIGKGEDPGPQFDPAVRAGAIKNTQLRIDAVGWKGVAGVQLPEVVESPSVVYGLAPGAQASIIEVKRRAAPSNVGQILTYDSVWRQEFTGSPAPVMRLVCHTYSPHILARVREAGINLDVVDVDFSGLAKPK